MNHRKRQTKPNSVLSTNEAERLQRTGRPSPVQTNCQRCLDLRDFLPDAYLVTDVNGVVVETNPAVRQLFSPGNCPGLGDSLPDRLPPADRKTFHDHVMRLRPGSRVAGWEVGFSSKGREPLWVSITLGGIYDSTGKLLGLRWLIRDIGEMKQICRELAHTYRRLERLVEERLAGYAALGPRLPRKIPWRKAAEPVRRNIFLQQERS